MSDCIGNTCKREGLTQRIAELTEQRDELLKAAKSLHSVVIRQNVLGASWHQEIFGDLMTALSTVTQAIAKAEKNAS